MKKALKKKKTIPKAEYGYYDPYDFYGKQKYPLDQNSAPQQIPEGSIQSYPGYMQGQMNDMTVHANSYQSMQPLPDHQLPVQPIYNSIQPIQQDYNQAQASTQPQKSKTKGSSFTTPGTGDFLAAGLQFANALLPNHENTNYQRKAKDLGYNANAYGINNSQANYANGGSMKGFHTVTHNQNGIITTEEVPDFPIQTITPQGTPHPYMPPIQPVVTPIVPATRSVNYENIHDAFGNQFASPIFHGYNHSDVQSFMSSSPNTYNNLPVLKGDQWQEMWNGFKPGTDSSQWTPTFQDGGELPEANSGIHIDPKNKGKFSKSAKSKGKGVQEYAHEVMSNSNSTPLQKKRANFAIQAKKWSKKENGGTLQVGQQLDLTPEELAHYKSLGYDFE